jgi:hypothetical protein
MNIKKRLQQLAFKRGIIVNKAVSPNELENFVSRFRSKYKSIELVRIGGDGDGGYLLPNNFTSVKYCFSPGVDYTAKFETELSKEYGIKSFMADASVSSPPLNDENFTFVKKFLGSRSAGEFITLSDWMKDCVADDAQDMILEMDIEGGEYDVLTFETAETLAKFSSMVIEFHGLQNIFERHFLQMISSIFEKLYRNFSICHVHPNNCSGIASLHGIDVPRVLEVSFIRNDLIDRFKSDTSISLPHLLDKKNVENKSDICMPEMWWKI